MNPTHRDEHSCHYTLALCARCMVTLSLICSIVDSLVEQKWLLEFWHSQPPKDDPWIFLFLTHAHTKCSNMPSINLHPFLPARSASLASAAGSVGFVEYCHCSVSTPVTGTADHEPGTICLYLLHVAQVVWPSSKVLCVLCIRFNSYYIESF